MAQLALQQKVLSLDDQTCTRLLYYFDQLFSGCDAWWFSPPVHCVQSPDLRVMKKKLVHFDPFLAHSRRIFDQFQCKYILAKSSNRTNTTWRKNKIFKYFLFIFSMKSELVMKFKIFCDAWWITKIELFRQACDAWLNSWSK